MSGREGGGATVGFMKGARHSYGLALNLGQGMIKMTHRLLASKRRKEQVRNTKLHLQMVGTTVKNKVAPIGDREVPVIRWQ